MNTASIVPRCKKCGNRYTVYSVSVSHEGTHCNIYIECLCVLDGIESTVCWSFEQLAYFAIKLIEDNTTDEEEDVLLNLKDTGRPN